MSDTIFMFLFLFQKVIFSVFLLHVLTIKNISNNNVKTRWPYREWWPESAASLGFVAEGLNFPARNFTILVHSGRQPFSVKKL